MTKRQNERRQAAWCTYPADNCTCQWINRSDSGGWDLVNRDPRCPRHGDSTEGQ